MRILFAIAVVLLFYIRAAHSEDQPIYLTRISVSDTELKYYLFNESDRVIIINKISAGCSSCKSEIKLDAKVMFPKQGINVTITKNRGKQEAFPKELFLFVDDSDDSVIRLPLAIKK